MDKHSLVKARLLFKLCRRRNWGQSHTAFDNLKKGFKPADHEQVLGAANDLLRQNFLIKKPTGYGLHVSLNPEKARAVKQLVFELLGVKID